jgi:hypothetical protein
MKASYQPNRLYTTVLFCGQQVANIPGRGKDIVLFVCVGAAGAFNLFSSLLAGLAVWQTKKAALRQPSMGLSRES